jgi:hypothetical protein
MKYRSKIIGVLLIDIIAAIALGYITALKEDMSFGLGVALLVFVILYFFSAQFAHNFELTDTKINISNDLAFWRGENSINFNDIKEAVLWDVNGSFELSLRLLLKNGVKRKFGFRGFTFEEKNQIVEKLRGGNVDAKKVEK